MHFAVVLVNPQQINDGNKQKRATYIARFCNIEKPVYFTGATVDVVVDEGASLVRLFFTLTGGGGRSGIDAAGIASLDAGPQPTKNPQPTAKKMSSKQVSIFIQCTLSNLELWPRRHLPFRQ